MTRVAAVTGATGTIGSATIPVLLSDGWDVRVLVRQQRSDLDQRIVQVVGDVRNVPEEFLAGADTVFNIAGVNTMCPDDRDLMWQVNVEAPANVYEKSAAAGVRRMVHLSSAATVGHRTSFYAETKWAGDQALARVSGVTELISLAPVSVQGPGRVTGTGKLILQMLAGRLKFMIDTSISIVDIDDTAQAIMKCADSELADGPLLLSGFSMTTRQAIDVLTDLVGRPIPVRYVPRALLGAVSLVGPLLPALGKRLGVDLCGDLVRTMRSDHLHDGTKAAEHLGLTYTSAEDTFRRLIDWAES